MPNTQSIAARLPTLTEGQDVALTFASRKDWRGTVVNADEKGATLRGVRGATIHLVVNKNGRDVAAIIGSGLNTGLYWVQTLAAA